MKWAHNGNVGFSKLWAIEGVCHCERYILVVKGR